MEAAEILFSGVKTVMSRKQWQITANIRGEMNGNRARKREKDVRYMDTAVVEASPVHLTNKLKILQVF